MEEIILKKARRILRRYTLLTLKGYTLGRFLYREVEFRYSLVGSVDVTMKVGSKKYKIFIPKRKQVIALRNWCNKALEVEYRRKEEMLNFWHQAALRKR